VRESTFFRGLVHMKARNCVAYRKFHTEPCSFIKRRKESTFYLYFFTLLVWWSRNIIVGTVSKPRVRRFCIRIADSSYRFISVPGRPYQLWGSPRLMFNGYPAYYLGVNRPGREVDHPLQSSVEVKNKWSCTSAPPRAYSLHGQGKLYLSTLFIWRCPTRHYRKILDPYRQISQFRLLTFFQINQSTRCINLSDLLLVV
jgi:hypothetical protein